MAASINLAQGMAWTTIAVNASCGSEAAVRGCATHAPKVSHAANGMDGSSASVATS